MQMMDKREFQEGNFSDFPSKSRQLSERWHSQSPLYKMSGRDIADHTFEIILTMEGITPETGNTVQVSLQKSYNTDLKAESGKLQDHIDNVVANYLYSITT